MASDYELVMEQGKRLVDFYRQNPCIAAYDLLGVDLAPIQRVIFKDMWFKNYVIAVCGRGVGKSVFTESLTLLPGKGLLHLDEVLPEVPAYLNASEEEIQTLDMVLTTAEGPAKTKRLCLEKEISGKQIITSNGYINRGSNHHPVLTINSDGEFIYRSLDSLEVGDYVCIQRGQQVFGSTVIPEDDAYLMGLFIGDGMIADGYNYVSITSEDDDIIDFCEEYCIENNISYRIDPDKRTKNTRSIIFKKFQWFFEKYKIKRTTSYFKSVPFCIRTANMESQVAFLRGYFDTDGGVEDSGVSCCSVSHKLMTEVQMMLLNLDIISSLRTKKTKSKFGKAYVLDIRSKDAELFSSLVGFGLNRKQELLEQHYSNVILNPNKDVVPYIKNICYEIVRDYRELNSKKYNDNSIPTIECKLSNKRNFTYKYLRGVVKAIDYVVEHGYTLSSSSLEKLNLLHDIIDKHYYFDTIKSIDDWTGDCYDFEMDVDGVEPNYFANGFINHNTFLLGLLATLSTLLYPGYRVGLIGPVFRQSKMIFSEVEKIYSKSPILREAALKKPTNSSDRSYLQFKPVAGNNGSYIEALPLGVDGSKIRGSRFYLILVDELAQVPDKILDMVVRPMAATSLEPMENVRRLEQQQRLISMGLATEDEFEDSTVNKIVMASSGYYKFNHMWRRMKDYWRQMEEAERKDEECQYSVWQVPYQDLPAGFLDLNNIYEAQRVMSTPEFQMEYEAVMISDSEGFFKASLLDECTFGSGVKFEDIGKQVDRYIVGVDPNQGGDASCGIVIIKFGRRNELVNVYELKGKTTQELTMAVQDIIKKFNVAGVYMDRGGGGKAIMDLLEEGYNGFTPVIDIENVDNRFKKGKRILHVMNFTPTWISDANFTALALLEDKRLKFPEPPVSSVVDEEALAFERVNTLKSQMLNIVVTQTRTGVLHFDTPKKGQNKDLYSALILAAYGVKDYERALEEDGEPILHNESGMMRPHDNSANWRQLSAGAGAPRMMVGATKSAALLAGKRRIK